MTTSIADAPIGTVQEEVARSKEYLRRLLKGPKPPISTKLLARPPYRYLHDLIMAMVETTTFATNLFTGMPVKRTSCCSSCCSC